MENSAQFIDSVRQLCDGIEEFDEGPFETYFLGDDHHYNIMWLLKSVPAAQQEAFVKYLIPWFKDITSGSERTALINILLHTPSSQRETFSQQLTVLFKGAEPYGNFFYGTALLWSQIPLDERADCMAIAEPLLPQLPTIFSRYHVLTALKNKTTTEREAFSTPLQNLVQGVAHLDGIGKYEYPSFCNTVDLFLGLPADQHLALLREMEPLAAMIERWDVRKVTQYFINQPYEQWKALSKQGMYVLDGAHQGSAVDVLKALEEVPMGERTLFAKQIQPILKTIQTYNRPRLIGKLARIAPERRLLAIARALEAQKSFSEGSTEDPYMLLQVTESAIGW